MQHHSRLGLMLSALLLAASAVLAQTPRTPSFGTTSLSSEVISSMDLVTDQTTTGIGTDLVNGHRYLTSTGLMFAPLHVPQGAVITGMELEACDPVAGGSVDVSLFRATEAATSAIGFVSTGIQETDGCSRWFEELGSPETVDNQTYRYYIEASNAPSNETETIGAVRVYYQLQVSPAPATATFGDVPTGHPFFQFVEALAASGITAGCGAGNFCPDSPLTRGQMAVFLSKALGLHWPLAPSN